MHLFCFPDRIQGPQWWVRFVHEKRTAPTRCLGRSGWVVGALQMGKIWQFPLVSSMVSIMIGTRGDRCFWNLGISRSLWLNHVAWFVWRHASCTWRHLIVLHIISNSPREATSFSTRVLFCYATAFHNISCLIVFCSGFTILWVVCVLNLLNWKILVAVCAFGTGRRQGTSTSSLHDQSYRVVWHDVTFAVSTQCQTR